jgi:hypothetical protein
VGAHELRRLLVRVDAETADEYRDRLEQYRAAELAAGSPDVMSLEEIDEEVASREHSLDLSIRLAVELGDGSKIERRSEMHTTVAFLSAIAEDDLRSAEEHGSEVFEQFKADLLELDSDALESLALALGRQDIDVSISELADAPRELDLTERAARAIREAIARDLRLDAELGE